MKKVFCLALLATIITTFVLINPCYALKESYVNNEKAIDLKLLGLYIGNDKDFELGRAPTKGEGLLVLAKLLGTKQEINLQNFIQSYNDDNPTLNLDEPLSAQEFISYIFKALGYEDDYELLSGIDIFEKAVQINLLSKIEAEALRNKSFIRDDLILLSYNALKTKLVDSNITLLDKLIKQDMCVSETIATTLGLYTSELQNELGGITDFTTDKTNKGYVINNSTDFFKILRKTLYMNDTEVNIDFSSYSGDLFDDFKATFLRAEKAVTKATGVEHFASSWEYSSKGTALKLKIGYRYTKNEFLERKQHSTDAINKARYTIIKIIKPGMTEFNKELTIHDYIINNTKYDYTNYLKDTIPYSSYEAYGCIVLGKAVCEGYSKAMKLLCDLAGLDCRIITGKARDTGDWQDHAWNIVKIDGEFYHVDVTFDDPISANNMNVLTHYYFNLSDKDLSKQYVWVKADYPPCKSTLGNYYTVNKLVAKNITDVKNIANNSFNKKVSQFEIKILNYSPTSYPDISTIIKKCGKVSFFYYSINKFLGVVRTTDIKYK